VPWTWSGIARPLGSASRDRRPGTGPYPVRTRPRSGRPPGPSSWISHRSRAHRPDRTGPARRLVSGFRDRSPRSGPTVGIPRIGGASFEPDALAGLMTAHHLWRKRSVSLG